LQVRTQHKSGGKLHRAVDPILKDLGAMANKFPEDSSTFVNAQQQVAAHQTSADTGQATQVQKPADGVKGLASSSIQDIYAFLKSDDVVQGAGAQLPSEERMLLSNSGELQSVTGVYQGLLENVHTKEKAIDDQLKWCGSIARDAKVDSDAVARSLKWTDAKLNLVRVAMSEYNRTVAFNGLQQDAIAARSAQLHKLADVEEGELQRSYDTLKQYGQQLLSLVTELEQKSSAEERKGAEVVKDLMSRVTRHQGLLQQWRVQSRDRREAVSSTSKAVVQALVDGAKQSSRRLVKLKVESQVLTSLASSKAMDKQLSEKYEKLSQQLCSASQAKQLQAKGSKLREEAAAVQKSLSSLTQPLA